MASSVNALVAKIAGAVLALVGILGFVMPSPLLGMFEVNTMHNVVHLLSGAVLLAAGFMTNGSYSRVTNQVLGVVYLLVAILGWAAPDLSKGLIGDAASTTGLVADNVLHLLLGVVLLAVGFGVKDEATTKPGARAM